MSIFTLSSKLRLLEEFTTNVAQLTEALQSPKATSQSGSILAQRQADLGPLGDEELLPKIADKDPEMNANILAGGGGRAIALIKQFLAEIASKEADQRMKITVDAMQQLARYLSAIPGRKNLIWFSGTFPIAIDPDDTLIEPGRTMRDYSGDIRKISELFSAARVAVYPVDARGMMTMPSADASYKPAPNVAFGRVTQPVVAQDDLRFVLRSDSERSAMQKIADETGGKEYIHTNGLKDAVSDAVENGSSYYTVGYVPAAKKLNTQFHKIQFRLDERAGSGNSDRGLSGGSVRPQPRMAGMRRADDQTSTPEPYSGLQSEGGLGRDQRRKDTFRVGGTV
jgi:VWFA-related protein